MTAPRLALITAVAASAILLAGCVPTTPNTPAPDPTTAAPEPEVAQLAELSYPLDGETFLGYLAEDRVAFEDWYASFTADCDAEAAGGADAPDCTERMLTGLQSVNAIKTLFTFSFSDDDWADDSYTGLAALGDTRTGIESASSTGSDFIDTCYYVPGGDGSGTCVDTAQAFLDDVDEIAAAMQTWEI